MGAKKLIGGLLGGAAGFALGGPSGAMAGYGIGSGLGGGSEDEGKAEDYQRRALAMAEQQYNERAPMRRLGMQALGQIERPMDLGHLGFNPSNPYAAARGPSPSTSSYGNWGEMTYTMPDEPLPGAGRRQGMEALGQRLGGSGSRALRNVGRKLTAQAPAAEAAVNQRAASQPRTRYGWER